ncbi:S-layer homology domain-containing protein [Ureibacillus manganicus]|uniref:S-layer homology domain-containing protein n=1 Tax=Ureibacillus manganicus TaxID=1266064 RepID=UPI000690EDF5|nr:S-layer homology domain-containing protein [Ureibacillus manganicus]
MIKRILGFLLSFLLAFSIIFPQNAAKATGDIYITQINFIDLSKNYWANDAINNMAKSGIISGYKDETFRPENPVSRAEFATLISKTFYLDLPTGSQATFYDVQPSHWSYPYVEASKDFLTGYYPPSGRAFFSPDMNATREDVAVTLVKALGYTVDDLKNRRILEQNFNDVDSISPNLRDYVAIAYEKELFSGYPDYTFRGDAPINRAEVATLLYKIIKNAATDGNSDIVLEVSAPEKVNEPTVYISGTTSRGATVKIDGKDVNVVNGKFNNGYTLKDEGLYEFEVTARIAGGKTKTVVKQVLFERSGPVLIINDIPSTTQSQKITVSGRVENSDKKNYSTPDVYLNNKVINYWSGRFETSVTLVEGENVLTFKAVDKHGKETIVTKIVYYTVGNPVIKFDYIPDTTTSSEITLSGTIEDPNDNYPKIYINDQLINTYSKKFSRVVTLKEGENTFKFVVVNSAGKTTTETRTVILTSDGPELIVDYIPETTTSSTLRVSWNVKDPNDYSPKVYVNDKLVQYYSSTTINLVPGENTITFRATNKLGKMTTVTKTITLNIPAPVLTIGYLPETTTSSSVTATWTVKDENDYYPKVYINDQLISYSSSKTLNLVDGPNVFVFRAVNSSGVKTEVTKTIVKISEATEPIE